MINVGNSQVQNKVKYSEWCFTAKIEYILLEVVDIMLVKIKCFKYTVCVFYYTVSCIPSYMTWFLCQRPQFRCQSGGHFDIRQG